METNRQKIFKQKIKSIVTEPETINKRKTRYKNKNQTVRNKSQKKNTEGPISSYENITILGSRSYHEQNKNLLGQQSEPLEKSAQIMREETIDLKIEETNILENTHACAEKENRIEGYEYHDGQNNPSTRIVQKKTKMELNEIMEIEVEPTQEVSIPDNDNDQTFHVLINIEIEEETLHDCEDTTDKMDTIEQETGISVKQSQEQIVGIQNTINKESNTHLQANYTKEKEKQEKKRHENENNQRLTPSIREEIPETEMEELRKSLEVDGNTEEINLPSFDDDVTPLEKADDVVSPEKDSIEAASEKAHDVVPPEKDSNIIASKQNDDVAPLEKNDDAAPPEKDDDVAPPEKDDDVAPNEKDDDVEPPERDLNKKRQNRREVTIKRSYVDFLSEEEDFIWDSTSWKETDDESTSTDLESHRNRRKKFKKRSQENLVGDDGLKKKRINKRKLNKEAKHCGKEYKKKDGSIIRAKELQANPCVGKKCGHDCGNVSEEKRKGIFDHYWSLSVEKRKDWLVAMSFKKKINRKRSKDSSYRTNTFEYFINEGEGRRQVCLQFILKTLDVSQRYVYYTLSNVTLGSAKTDQRGKIIPTNKTSEAVKISAVNFIKKLPALPSHYSRKDSTRLYLPVEVKNIKNLYRIYKEEQVTQGVDVVSERIFREIFTKDFNLGFHVPKKDKCIKCLRFEGQDISESAEMKNHLEEKEASKKRMACHREITKKNPSILCASFDLQKVLNTPYGNSMLLFYSRKYTVYNLCFYESVTRNGYCYVWGETEGKRGGNEIATILNKYIDTCDQQGTVKTLILYSDSCPGQNKNKLVLAALHNALLVAKNLETIQMNYLLPGHTEMTVDSVHSTIENSVRNTTVWAPSQWLTICQIARREPGAYNVEALTHGDFKNYKEFSEKYFKGNLVGKISKIRVATFKKSTPNIMTIKYSMKDGAQEESVSIFAKPKLLNAKYKSSLPITKSKYNDLKKLCDTGVIPKIFHSEYVNLPCNNGTKDVLIDTDIEDETDE